MGSITKEERRRRDELAKKGIKVCSRCKRELTFEMFPLNKSTKDGMGYWCTECMKEYYQENKEYFENYYDKNKKNIAKNAKVYREEHPDKMRKLRKNWYVNNQDKVKSYLHSDRVIMMRRMYQNNLRTLMVNAECKYGIEDVQKALLFFDNKCSYTGAPLDEKYHLDHIVALKNGGTNYIWNIVPCNPSPNESKGTKDMESWFCQQEYFSEERLNKIYEWIDLKKQELEGDKNE